MNFRILARVSLLVTLLFASCGNPTLSEPLTREYETYTGTFTSLGSIKISSSATHLFETNEGEVLYAFSDRYDLDDYDTPMEAYGTVTTYTELDKPLFEVSRLTEAEESTTEIEEVTKVEYRNVELGVMSKIYSNWEVETNAQSGLVSFKMPLPPSISIDDTSAPGEEPSESIPLQDTIDLIYFKEALKTTADASIEDRAADIQNYVIQNYQDLDTVTPDQITVGVDRVPGVRYKAAAGDVYVFIPRNKDLMELSYHYLHMDDALRIQNTNLFSGFLNDFRFIPADTVEDTTETVTTSDDVTAPTVTQVEFSKFSSFSSTAFMFSMSYPAAWYYAGGSTGYSFSDQSLDDVNAQSILKLEFNTGDAEGTVRNGDLVSITKKVESRTYSLTGSAEYEMLMKTMLDSIQTTKAE